MAENEIPISFKWYLNRQGIQGQQGERGEEGFSPTITVNEDTLTAYTLKVQNKTGSFVTPNLRQVVSDSGGTYVRYDRTSGNLYAGNADFATTEQAGMVRFCTEEELNSAYDGSVVSPADLVDYLTNTYQLPIATAGQIGAVKPDGTTITIDPDGTIHGASTYNLPTASATVLGGIKVGSGLSITDDGVLSASGGSSDLSNITDTDSGVAITDADSGLTYPQTINIIAANEDENYSYIQCKSSGSSLSSGIKFDLGYLTLMGGLLNGTTSGRSAGIRLKIPTGGSNNPCMVISEPVFLNGKRDISNVVDNLLAFDYTHATETSGKLTSNGFFIFNARNTYTGTFTTNGILFTVGDEPSIKFTTSTSDNGVWTDNVNATVLTDKTGIQYKALTSAEYTELQTKSDSTIYKLTDTNQVYLGTIPLTGGGASVQQSTFVNYPESSIVKMNALKSDTQVASGYPDAMKIVIGDSTSTSYNIRFSYPGSSLPNADGTGYTRSDSYYYNLNLTRGTRTGTTVATALLYYYNRTVYYTDSLDNLKSYVSGFNASQAIYVGSGSVVNGQLQQLTSVPEYVINNFTGG